jgi:hypothetical protein
MYKEHPVFIQPEDENIKVWRYMDFTKLISLIDSQCLYFTRVDKLNDPFEGSYPQLNVLGRMLLNKISSPMPRDQFLRENINVSKSNKDWVRFAAVNCWHMNEDESAAMWSLYLKSNEGVAIQSTYTRLKKSIIDDEDVYLGTVKYIDYKKESIKSNNTFARYVHKRKSFDHEREVRAMVSKFPPGNTDASYDISQETIHHGLNIKVDLKTLIENIYIAPTAPVWLADLIRDVIKKYGYEFNVKQSDLNANPLF